MALGGGTFVTQNKVLPGAYINFVSKSGASAALSDRGIVTMPLTLTWGPDDEVFEVTSGDFQKNSMKIFGQDYADDSMKGLRDLFLNATTGYFYRLNGGGVKASNDIATAKYSGTRGNDITIVIQKNVDDDSLYDVTTKLGTTVVDLQTVAKAADLVTNNFVTWKGAELAVTAGTPLAGGTDGKTDAAAYQKYLDRIEPYRFNVMGVVTTDDAVKSLIAAFTKRLRDEMGIKFQTVLHKYTKPDYLGVISVENDVTDEGADPASAVYWTTGAEAGCEVNRSVQNRTYNGEFTINVKYTQNQLITAIEAGKFMFHQVDGDVKVLQDINTMVTTSDTMGDDFKDNQTIRVCDQIANDEAVLFNTKYSGIVPNDKAGRVSLWTDIVKLQNQLQDIRAIEDFKDTDVTVDKGETKKSVVVNNHINVVNAMSKLYMTVVVA